MDINFAQMLNKIKRDLDRGVLSPDEHIQVLWIHRNGRKIIANWYYCDLIMRVLLDSDAAALRHYKAERPLLEIATVAEVLTELECEINKTPLFN